MNTVWLTSFLSFWLLLTVARQVFDLIGRLWVPVAFNLLQLVCLITGLFGVCQRRLSLLIVFVVSCLFSIAQNVLISLWYLGVFGDRTRPVLSGGLPYSFSFFLRYTPGCDSHFDLARSKWVQSACVIPYYQLETVLAILNILLAVGCIAFTVCLFLAIRKERRDSIPKTPLPSAYSHLGPPSRGPNSRLPEAPSSVNDMSSGYMNSSYEEVNEVVRMTPSPQEPPKPPPKPTDRNLKKKKGKPRPQSMPQPDLYSSAETEEIRKEDFYTKPQKLKKNGGAGGGRFKKQQEQNTRRPPAHEDRRVSRSSSVNTTSLVSFDPKSGTLLRVKEHVDSDDEYGRHEVGVDVGSIYERIRPREEPVPNPRLTISSRSKNASQDSVPSTLAPVLVSPQADGSSCDSGVPSSSCEQWPPAERPFSSNTQITSPGIRLSQPEYVCSPGIRLSSAIAMERQRRSSFQIQPQESRRVIGHYHSVNEFPLTDTEDTPVIKGRSLLV